MSLKLAKNKSNCALLNHFEFADIVISKWVPNDASVFKLRLGYHVARF